MAEDLSEDKIFSVAMSWVKEAANDPWVDQELTENSQYEEEGPGTEAMVPVDVEVKNKFLGLVADLSEKGGITGFLIYDLEKFARNDGKFADDDRAFQLLGLLELVAACVKHEDLRSLFEQSSLDIEAA